MPTTTSPPILIWQPGGGTPIWTPAPRPGHAAPENGLTALVIGQNYVDVVFVTAQPRSDWTFAGLEVVNVTDTAPLNIWVGVATNKTRNGFRVYLNGLPDTGNYYLDWTINGGTVADAGTATSYLLSGPDSGPIGVATAFTVALPMGATVDASVTIIPNDGGIGGTFSPVSVTLTTDLPSANFTYTPAQYGPITIGTMNGSLLTDPSSIDFTSVVATYLLSGPSGGTSGVASTNFTVALPVGGVTLGAITVGPGDGISGLGGVFTPSAVNLTTAAPSATFTYTPNTPGAKTISTTNNRGLTDPAPLTYTATAAALHDGDPVSTWHDSSGNGHDASQTGSARPIFKAGIIGGKPVVRFTSAGHSGLNLASAIPADGPWTIFAVMKANSPSVAMQSLCTNGSASFPAGPLDASDGNFYFANRTFYGLQPADYSAAFHVFASEINASSGTVLYTDGTLQVLGTGGALASAGNFDALGYNGFTPAYSDGDLAEVIIYSSQLAIRAKLLLVLTALITTGQIPSPDEADALLAAGDLVALEAYLISNWVSPEQAQDVVTPMTVGDRANIEKYLGTKYGITVAGGTAVDPSTVAGLLGWWKADSLG